MALRDKVPSDDIERADLGARTLFPNPAEQGWVCGHYQVLQGFRWVRADVFQILCEIDPRNEETSCQTAYTQNNAFHQK